MIGFNERARPPRTCSMRGPILETEESARLPRLSGWLFLLLALVSSRRDDHGCIDTLWDTTFHWGCGMQQSNCLSCVAFHCGYDGAKFIRYTYIYGSAGLRLGYHHENHAKNGASTPISRPIVDCLRWHPLLASTGWLMVKRAPSNWALWDDPYRWETMVEMVVHVVVVVVLVPTSLLALWSVWCHYEVGVVLFCLTVRWTVWCWSLMVSGRKCLGLMAIPVETPDGPVLFVETLLGQK